MSVETEDLKGKSRRKNLICNFRAPTLEEFLKHKAFVKQVKQDGLDACRVLIAFEDAYLASKKGFPGEIKFQTPTTVTNIQMNNTFQYQVLKPRREPYNLDCVKPEFRRTFSSVLLESYVLQKASRINMEFSFRDFLELDHASFRRIVARLLKKGEIVKNPVRTNPQFFYLASKLNEMDNTTVKPGFKRNTGVCEQLDQF
jgi:hypothetical protein